ncbi:MAG: winged helix DNA-binding protein [Saprospiraceae bacterium]|nr:winged helix DNA-binding protein [Saprospiraceae bacterium]
MHYNFYRQLMNVSEEFEQHHLNPEQLTLEHFSAWLSMKLSSANKTKEADKRSWNQTDETLEVGISKLVGFMHRYARIYLKKAFEKTPLTTPDDFSYLAALAEKGFLSKTELIEENIHEKTSGMEVIKRLLNAGLIVQTEHPSDRRSKIISITEKGQEVLYGVFDELRTIAKLVSGNLTDLEKQQLFYLLQKLDHFHRPIYLNERDAPLEQILAKERV